MFLEKLRPREGKYRAQVHIISCNRIRTRIRIETRIKFPDLVWCIHDVTSLDYTFTFPT